MTPTQINSDGRTVRANAYTMISAKDKSRKPGDVIPCRCGREGCVFVFDVTAARQEYRTDGCRSYVKRSRENVRNARRRGIK